MARARRGAAGGEFNVRDFGAAGDGAHLDSAAINRAIAAAGHRGGGTVRVPAGTYLSGSIHLQNNIHLLIDAGATLLGAPQETKAYDETEPFTLGGYQDGGHCFFHNSLIWGENLTNVSITGPGMINGGGLVRDDDALDRMVGFGQFDPTVTNAAPPVRLGNKAIALKLCRNVLLRDVTIFHGGHFAVLLTGCDNSTVDNVTMDTDRDGIDIDCCRDTMVSNCRINSPNDDGLCPKSTYALGECRLTENLTIVNCQVSGFEEGTLLDGTQKPSKSHTGRIKFGTESSGGFLNCTVANCTFRSCHGLALEEVDGGRFGKYHHPESGHDGRAGLRDLHHHRQTQPYSGRDQQQPDKEHSHFNVIADGVGKMSGIRSWGWRSSPSKTSASKMCASSATAAAPPRTPPPSPRNWAGVIRNQGGWGRCRLMASSRAMSKAWSWQIFIAVA